MAKKRNRLFEIRSILGLTQADFGQRLGVTKTYIYLIESGRKPLSNNILNLAELLLAQYDPQKPSDIPQDSLVQIRAELAHLRAELTECKAQLKESHATIAIQARTIASSTPPPPPPPSDRPSSPLPIADSPSVPYVPFVPHLPLPSARGRVAPAPGAA